MALSERGKNIRFVAIAIAVLLVVAAALMLFFGFSKSHELKMDGYEITADGVRPLRVEAAVKTHDYPLFWQDGVSGRVDVLDGEEQIERLQLAHGRREIGPNYEIATVRTMWEGDAWINEMPYSASQNTFTHLCVAVGENMDWLVVTNAFYADVEPRIWVFATDRDVGYEVTERAIAQFYWQFEGETPLQNPWE